MSKSDWKTEYESKGALERIQVICDHCCELLLFRVINNNSYTEISIEGHDCKYKEEIE